LLFLFVGIAVTAMTILTIHNSLRTGARAQSRANRVALRQRCTDRHGMRQQRSRASLYPLGLLHSAPQTIRLESIQLKRNYSANEQEMGQHCF
jgi:hypothetical protein